MNHHKLEIYFFFALFIGILWASFEILKPFAFSLVLAIVFAVIFQGLYKKLITLTNNKSIAATLTIIVVLTTIMVPLALFGTQVFNESQDIYFYIVSNGGTVEIAQQIEDYINNIQDYLAFDGRAPAYFEFDFETYIKNGLNWLLQNLGSIFSSFAHITINTFIFLLAFYYLLKDGVNIKRRVISLSPLADKYDEEISEKIQLAINSVVRGTLVIAILQGFLMGFGLYIFGVPNPAFWGSITAISALVPGVGTALISIPAIIYLFIVGNLVGAIGLTIWAITIVGLVDNFLYPKLVERKVKIHSFFILLFVFGGLIFFGPIGFILGPVILSLLSALIDVYSFLMKETEESKNIHESH